MHNYHYMQPQMQGSYQPMNDDIQGFCHNYRNFHVIAQLEDGALLDAIIESVEENGVILLIAEEVEADQLRQEEDEETFRQFQGYGRPGRRRYRRYRRQRFPFNVFRSLFLYPFYPYYYPYPWY